MLTIFIDRHPVNFVYPTNEQIVEMSRVRPIEIYKLRWQVEKIRPYYIASIGITLANGTESSMFTGIPKEELSEIKEIKISEQTKTIVASKTVGFYATQNLKFKNKEDQLIGSTEILLDYLDELDDPIER